MVADIFIRDYRSFKAQGLEPEPEDVIRLNALAVKAKHGSWAARTMALPRVAFMPRDTIFRSPLMFREPTVAHELWLERAERFVDTSDARVQYWLYGFALSREAKRLPDVTRNPRKTLKAVFTFAARRLCRFTRPQLVGAVDYALFGADWTVGEHPAQRNGNGGADRETVPEAASPTIGLMLEAKALKLPISLDEAKTMTASELEEAISRALRAANKLPLEEMRHRALGNYALTRNRIKERLTKEAEKNRQTKDRGTGAQ